MPPKKKDAEKPVVDEVRNGLQSKSVEAQTFLLARRLEVSASGDLYSGPTYSGTDAGLTRTRHCM